MSSAQEVRARVASIAMGYIGSRAWSDAVARGTYPANSNKCNLFVYEVLTEAGASPGLPHGHWYWNQYPPNAVDWASVTATIPHWKFLKPDEKPEAGDVIAQSLAYTDATGHVMIMGPHNMVIGTGDSSDGPPGTIEFVVRPIKLGPKPKGPEVFRRWSPEP